MNMYIILGLGSGQDPIQFLDLLALLLQSYGTWNFFLY
jgi:hypothetical protein